MRKTLLYMAVAAVCALSAASCSHEELSAPLPDVEDNGSTITVRGTLSVPDMGEPPSRALGAGPSAGLKLTLVEFAKGTGPADSQLTRVYEAETTGTAADGTVSFSVELDKTTAPRVLHLMAAPDFVTCGYGSEAAVIPTVKVGIGGTQPLASCPDAYWARVEFDSGYADASGVPLAEVRERLTTVPMLRNFAAVSVTANESLANFELIGFELVNVPTSGTIAPWNADGLQFPQFLDAAGTMKTYADISGGDTAAGLQPYAGVMPPATQFANTEVEARKWNTPEDKKHPSTGFWDSGRQYLYEHPFESTRRTYLLVQGIYGGDGVPSYYKIDLGETGGGDDGLFGYYDLLRNFEYAVTINSVGARGAATPAEAIDGLVYNNISASVEARNMLSVSDGDNMLVVGFTNRVIVDSTEPVQLRYQYITDVRGSKRVDNTRLRAVGLEAGDVIRSYTQSTDGDWAVLTIVPNEPDPNGEEKSQSFSIVDGRGLGRTVTLILHKPYEIGGMQVWPGTANTPAQADVAGAVRDKITDRNAGAELTVYFNLPDGLNEAMFPLQFRLEANRQNIENNPIGTLTAMTGPSLFQEPGTELQPAISYVKTVTYAEYRYNYMPGTSNEVNVNSPNVDHVVRCRFRTILSTTDAGFIPGENRVTKVRIYNPYFVQADATFTRTN